MHIADSRELPPVQRAPPVRAQVKADLLGGRALVLRGRRAHQRLLFLDERRRPPE